jgi:hypothetical protein
MEFTFVVVVVVVVDVEEQMKSCANVILRLEERKSRNTVALLIHPSVLVKAMETGTDVSSN